MRSRNFDKISKNYMGETLECNNNIKLFYFYIVIVEYMINNNKNFQKVYFHNWTFNGHKII